MRARDAAVACRPCARCLEPVVVVAARGREIECEPPLRALAPGELGVTRDGRIVHGRGDATLARRPHRGCAAVPRGGVRETLARVLAAVAAHEQQHFRRGRAAAGRRDG